MINPQDYLKNPEKYGDVVILSADDYEEYEAYLEILAAEADVDAGNFYTEEEFDRLLDDHLAQAETANK